MQPNIKQVTFNSIGRDVPSRYRARLLVASGDKSRSCGRLDSARSRSLRQNLRLIGYPSSRYPLPKRCPAPISARTAPDDRYPRTQSDNPWRQLPTEYGNSVYRRYARWRDQGSGRAGWPPAGRSGVVRRMAGQHGHARARQRGGRTQAQRRSAAAEAASAPRSTS